MRFDTAFADRVTAIVLFALGVAMLGGGFTMDRLEIRHIHPASIPGLVPMILGLGLMICAALLFLNARHKAVEAGQDSEISSQSWRSFLIAAALSVFYALALVGRAPFFLATAGYITVFLILFSWPEQPDRNKRIRLLIFAVIFGGVIAGGISVLFRYGFLVRLP